MKKNKNIKKILVISLLLNLLLILVLGVFILKLGGISFVKDKLVTVLSLGSEEPVYNPHYLSRESLFEEMDSVNNKDTVFVGDSITEGNEWGEVFGNLSIKNRGIGWDTTDGVLNRLDTVIENEPQKIFLMIGTNDFLSGISVEKTIENYRKIIDTIKSESPKTKIFIESLLPVNKEIFKSATHKNENITELNEGIKKIADENNISYLDIASKVSDDESQLRSDLTFDGLHLNGEGYSIWEKEIEKYIVN